MRNILGVDVSGLDVEAFLRTGSLLFPLAALCWLAIVMRARRPTVLLLGVLAANGFVWFMTNYPLARLYALGASGDRMNNLAMCQVVASGHTPMETWQVGQSNFASGLRPYVMLWTVLVSFLSGFDPERLLPLYGLLPLLMACGFALALYFGLGPANGGFWSPWQRAIVAGSATLMASAPTDFMGTYDVPWALMFLLKPNHALGLVLFPLVLRAFADIDGWWRRIGAGLLLHLLGWAFALHLAYVTAGLIAFLGLSVLFRRDELRRDVVDTLAVVGVSVAIVAPYLVRLALAPSPVTAPAEPPEIMRFGSATPMLLEATLRTGLVFPAGLWGAWHAWRRGGRLGRLLAAQLGAALLLWLGYSGAAMAEITPRGLLGEILEQPDEIFYWLRFVAAACAGMGVWDLAGRVIDTWFGAHGQAVRAAAAALVCLPWSLPYWWNPIQMDRYFSHCRKPLPEELREFGRFLIRETKPSAVLVGDPLLMRYAAALAGRRSLFSVGPPPPPDVERRWELSRAVLSGTDPAAFRTAADTYGVTHIVVTPSVRSVWRLPDLQPARFDARPDLVRVFLGEGPEYGFIRVYRITPPGPG